MKFRKKKILVTGAGSGIGLATSQLFAKEGGELAILDWREDRLTSLASILSEKGCKSIQLLADISDEEQMTIAFDKLKTFWGNLDVVFANAGVNGVCAPFEEIKTIDWDNTININLRGTFLTIKKSLDLLKVHGGSIIVTSSVIGTRVFSIPGFSVYSASKAGIASLAKALSVELAQYNIRVNVICPGNVMTDNDRYTTYGRLEKIKEWAHFPNGFIPLTGKKSAKPEQVARTVVFLASREADHITGTEIFIDGAESLVRG